MFSSVFQYVKYFKCLMECLFGSNNVTIFASGSFQLFLFKKAASDSFDMGLVTFSSICKMQCVFVVVVAAVVLLLLLLLFIYYLIILLSKSVFLNLFFNAAHYFLS
jgi:uncharacterized integral membrane protein